jgi:hypothetical protein
MIFYVNHALCKDTGPKTYLLSKINMFKNLSSDQKIVVLKFSLVYFTKFEP